MTWVTPRDHFTDEMTDGQVGTANRAFGPWDTFYVQARGIPDEGDVEDAATGACPPDGAACDTTGFTISCEGLMKLTRVPPIQNKGATDIRIAYAALTQVNAGDFAGLSELVSEWPRKPLR